MERPKCPQHPESRVVRDGRYGARKQYQRWRCVPVGCDRKSAESHLFQPVLPKKAVGGPHGECVECERGWHAGEGMDTAWRDRFSLREKAAALVYLAQGHPYRQAARQVRLRAQLRGADVSIDGRLTGDWVSMYAPVLRRQLFRTHPYFAEWPEVLVLDHVPFHGRDTYADGAPKPSGRLRFAVLGALSYGEGSVEDAHQAGRRPKVWRYGAYEGTRASDWLHFLNQLPGRPLWVVCDGDPALLAALEKKWPDIPIFRCTAHLTMQAQERVRVAGLRETPFGQSINEKTFTGRRRWSWFRMGLDYLEEHDLTAGLSRSQLVAVTALRDWADRVAPAVEFGLEHDHAPLTTGALEQALRVVKNSLYDRRLVLRNLDRLDDLLILFQLARLGLASEPQWARVLRDHHLRRGGKPPARRRVDNPALYPGHRGGRRPAAGPAVRRRR